LVTGVIADSDSLKEKSSKHNSVCYVNSTKDFKYNSALKVKFLNQDATIPEQVTKNSIRYNLFAIQDLTILKGEKGIIPTGLAMMPPVGHYIRIAPRSGLAVKNMIQVGVGVINPDYTGEIKVVLFNHGNQDFQVRKNDKIAPIILEKAKSARLEKVKELTLTD
jgi:dUTP pyrophosphatase